MSVKNIRINKYIQIFSQFPICHRLHHRTFNIWGHYLPVCARCTGLYTGAILFYTSSLFFFIEYSLKVISIAFIITFPLIIDGLTQYKGLRLSNNMYRLITGFLAGIGIALLITFIKITIF